MCHLDSGLIEQVVAGIKDPESEIHTLVANEKGGPIASSPVESLAPEGGGAFENNVRQELLVGKLTPVPWVAPIAPGKTSVGAKDLEVEAADRWMPFEHIYHGSHIIWGRQKDVVVDREDDLTLCGLDAGVSRAAADILWKRDEANGGKVLPDHSIAAVGRGIIHDEDVEIWIVLPHRPFQCLPEGVLTLVIQDGNAYYWEHSAKRIEVRAKGRGLRAKERKSVC